MSLEVNHENGGGIGNVLKSLRVIEQMKVNALADKMNVAASYICDVEANRKRPSLKMLKRYSNVFAISLSTLLYFNEQGAKQNYNHKKMLLNILNELVRINESTSIEA